MSSVLSSIAAAELFLIAFWRLSKRRAADEPAYSLSQNSSLFSSFSGLLESFSVSEVFPEGSSEILGGGKERLQ